MKVGFQWNMTPAVGRSTDDGAQMERVFVPGMGYIDRATVPLAQRQIRVGSLVRVLAPRDRTAYPTFVGAMRALIDRVGIVTRAWGGAYTVAHDVTTVHYRTEWQYRAEWLEAVDPNVLPPSEQRRLAFLLDPNVIVAPSERHSEYGFSWLDDDDEKPPPPTVRVRRQQTQATCMVCLEDTTDAAWCCRAPVHRACLQEWVKRSVSCPHCRRSPCRRVTKVRRIKK